MEALIEPFDVLPDSLPFNLRVGIYFLILFHFIAVFLWGCATLPTLFKTE